MSRLLDFCVGAIWGATALFIGVLIKWGYTSLTYWNLMCCVITLNLLYTLIFWEKFK